MYQLENQDLEYVDTICWRAKIAMTRAINKFPQPNYVLTKIAEEAGEVVKAGVHCAEGRDFTWEDLEGECIQTIAMCLRLLIEGDQIIGLTPPKSSKEPEHPQQPLLRDHAGTVRFKENPIVQYLLTNSSVDMNSLALHGFSDADQRQFAQLIGYSVSGYGDLPYAVNHSSVVQADKRAEEMINNG